MNAPIFESVSMDQLARAPYTGTTGWLWHGYLARGNLTLLTGMWKCGKTTLLAGILQHLGTGQSFLGRDCSAGRALVISEESREHWAARTRIVRVGGNAQLISRPFKNRPDAEAWENLVDEVCSLRTPDGLDLLAVDSLATFFPGPAESDIGTWTTMLDPLRRLAETGVAVLLLHHPRKKPSAEGNCARGARALTGMVDINLELRHCGAIYPDDGRRRLTARSRFEETPTRLYYHWDLTSGTFSTTDDPHGQQFRETWGVLKSILLNHQQPATHHELLANWPADCSKPSVRVLYEWLQRATEEKLVHRSGTGRRNDPHRFRIP